MIVRDGKDRCRGTGFVRQLETNRYNRLAVLGEHY